MVVVDGYWTMVKVTTSPEAVEAVTGIFMDVGVGGLEIDDPRIWQEYAKKNRYGEIYPKIDPGSLCTSVDIIGYLPGDVRNSDVVTRIGERVLALSEIGLNPAPALLNTALVEERDWAYGWRDYYHTQRIGERLIIKPTWEVFAADANDVVLDIDPGMAFGTGEHETTRLCLIQLEQLVRPEYIVYDIGTGSGILSLAAAKLGAARVVACDLDPVAVKVAQDNTAQNGLAARVSVHQGSIAGIQGKADLIVANIVTDVILDILPAVTERLVPGGHFVASGIIERRRDEVALALEGAALSIVVEESDSGWVCMVSRL